LPTIHLQAEKALQELRNAVRAHNGFVLGAFSYADITMAVAANVIDPLGPSISKYALPYSGMHRTMR
jgi:hypothetical protein